MCSVEPEFSHRGGVPVPISRVRKPRHGLVGNHMGLMVELIQGLRPFPLLWLPRADWQAWGGLSQCADWGCVHLWGPLWPHCPGQVENEWLFAVLPLLSDKWLGRLWKSQGGRLGEVCHRLLDCSVWVQSECVMSGGAEKFVPG